MVEERLQRRLAAILASDVVGYSRLMQTDEPGTLARLKKLRHVIIEEVGGRQRGATRPGGSSDVRPGCPATRRDHRADASTRTAIASARIMPPIKVRVRLCAKDVPKTVQFIDSASLSQIAAPVTPSSPNARSMGHLADGYQLQADLGSGHGAVSKNTRVRSSPHELSAILVAELH